MKSLTLAASAAMVLALAACGGTDRNVDATTGADSANTAVVDTPSATMPTDTTSGTGMNDTMGNAPMTGTGACEGLTGQAQTDCLNRAGPTGVGTQNDVGAPTSTDVPQPSNTDATTPPQS